MQKRIALFFSSFRAGGVERVQINLAKEFNRRGFMADLVVVSGKGELKSQIAENINIVDLGASRTLFAIPALIQYLRKKHPDVMIAAQTHNNCAAILAKKFAKNRLILAVTEHTDLSYESKNKSLKEQLRPFIARICYSGAQAIVAVSRGAAEALARTSGISKKRIHTIYNPVDIQQVIQLSKIKQDHPWLSQQKIPLLLAAGRLVEAKDYQTLLTAFSLVIKQRKAHLLILGEGNERQALENLAKELSIEKEIELPGFISNPYAFMAAADIFVLSSKREGLPTVLIEALACGTPVVSTNCPSGPAEILENGRYGKLVPVGDPQALADAMLETLEHPIHSDMLKIRASDFSVEKIADEYLRLIKIADENSD